MSAAPISASRSTDGYCRLDNEGAVPEPFDKNYVGLTGYCGPYNPALFAAAPDLLEACEALVASVTQETPRGNIYALGELHSAVDAARAAIAKATQP